MSFVVYNVSVTVTLKWTDELKSGIVSKLWRLLKFTLEILIHEMVNFFSNLSGFSTKSPIVSVALLKL